jgi:DNA-binding transcriptional LysR family regulator
VASGLGVTLIPESALQFRSEGVVTRRIRGADAAWRVGAAWREGRGQVVRDGFLAVLRDELAARPA